MRVNAAEAGRANAPRTVALIGNPNTGKTTLFNALTGLRHKVGNFPGCTVERRTGRASLPGGTDALLIDLPGTYSLAARSPDELIAVDVLLGQQAGEQPVDVVLAIVDASSLERNLYLVSQLVELDHPVVVALNMTDVARERRIEIDAPRLAERLGVPVVPIRADRREGLDALKDALADTIADAGADARAPSGPRAIERSRPALPEGMLHAARALAQALGEHREALGRELPPFEAVRAVVDRDGATERRLADVLGDALDEPLREARALAAAATPAVAAETGARYAWVRNLLDGCVTMPEHAPRTRTDRIDAVLTHGAWGSLILVAVLGIVFQAIYRWSAPLMDGIQVPFDAAGRLVDAALPAGPLESLLVHGVLGGVGSVVVFLPQILTLFFFLALLEDCGYMARAAFLMDRLFARLGLSGLSMIPLLSSFACAIPGIMAVRTIGSKRQRLATMLVAPLMSCSARLPVYVLLIGAFVPGTTYLGGLMGLRGLVLLGAHLVGVVVAILVLLVLKLVLLRTPSAPFLLELPPYRVPGWRTVFSRMLHQGRAFLVRAGTIIFAASIVVWALTYFPHPVSIAEEYDARIEAAGSSDEVTRLEREQAGAYVRQSFMGRAGRAIEPVVRPLGWDWRIGMAVVASFPAREVVIATMGTIFNLGDEVDETSSDLAAVLKGARHADGRPLFDLPVALSLIVFFALCAQCVSTLAIIRRESGSWTWPAVTFVYMTVLAWVGAFVTYHGARLLAG